MIKSVTGCGLRSLKNNQNQPVFDIVGNRRFYSCGLFSLLIPLSWGHASQTGSGTIGLRGNNAATCVRSQSTFPFRQRNGGVERIIGRNWPGSLYKVWNISWRPRSEGQGQDESIPNEAIEVDSGTRMKVLHVAEKNDAAKRIAAILSNGRSQTQSTHSTYNKIYSFPMHFRGQNCDMIMTSVSGHLLGFEFDAAHRKWGSCEPLDLFDAPVVKLCGDNFKGIMRTLEEQARQCQILVIWTDCDREGEGIGFEIIDVCRRQNSRLQIFRAKFSEITPTAINRAIATLGPPNKALSDAVDVRSELDLRIGAAFTRFQTVRLQKKFGGPLVDHVISYGSCQFPTLGFVVERYKAIENFVAEEFWKIEVMHRVDDCSVDFNWARVRLFNKLAVQVLYEKCLDNPRAKVIKVQSKPKNKWRPVAMDTVSFEKLASRKLRISAKDAMKIAEKLYTQGIISYPRTETNIFPKGLELEPLIQAQSASNQWGQFAQRVSQDGANPRNGKNTDQAHPPIHPTKFDNTLQGLEAKVYELIVRHFLACCSRDAVGHETTVEIEIAEERFVGHGLQVLQRNYLEVYIYEKWSDKELPHFEEGQIFTPTKIEMVESSTSPPNLLTEADLISLMEKHGIGTDATHAEHIEKIKERKYVGVTDGKFVPGQLGMGLVEGYDAMGFEMSKPHLRAEFEADLKGICDGRKNPQTVLREQLQKYKRVFISATDQVVRLDDAVGKFIVPSRNPPPPPPPNFQPPPSRRGGGGGGGFGGGGGRPPSDDDDPHPPPPRPPPRATNFQPQPRQSPRPTSRGRGRGGGVGQPSDDDDDLPGGDSLLPSCNCGETSASRAVKKDGANKGRLFFACPKPMDDPGKCNFFQWDDEQIGATTATRRGGRGGGQQRNQANFLPTMTRPLAPRGNAGNRGGGGRGRGGGGVGRGAPRKCSVCKEVGHTKRNCPVQLMDEDEEY